MTLGQKIKELRESHNILQRDLADRLNISDTFLSKVENNQKSLQRGHLRTLSSIFKYPLSEFEMLWIAYKILHLIKNEEEGIKALKFVIKLEEKKS